MWYVLSLSPLSVWHQYQKVSALHPLLACARHYDFVSLVCDWMCFTDFSVDIQALLELDPPHTFFLFPLTDRIFSGNTANTYQGGRPHQCGLHGRLPLIHIHSLFFQLGEEVGFCRGGDMPVSEDLKTFIIHLEIEQRRTIRESECLKDGKIPSFTICLGQNKLVNINEKILRPRHHLT